MLPSLLLTNFMEIIELVCMYVFVYVCIYTYMCVCACVCVNVCMCIYVCVPPPTDLFFLCCQNKITLVHGVVTLLRERRALV